MVWLRNLGVVLIASAAVVLFALTAWPWEPESFEWVQARNTGAVVASAVLQIGGLVVGTGIFGEFLEAFLAARRRSD
jgi:hypothetical protein